MIHLVTFSDDSMTRSAELCIESTKARGVDSALPFNPEGLVQSCPFLTFEGRGCGYWRWKPALIWNMLGLLPDGDILIYSDAGIEFINNVNYIIDRMDQDIFLFGNQWEHAHWCKRDIIEAIWPSHPQESPQFIWQRFDKQVQASVVFFRVSDYSRKFVKEWLDWCLSGVRIGAAVSFGRDNPEHCDERMTWSEFRYLIDDSPSVFPNHPEFRENRHDQAILTTMAYREGIRLHWWPAQYNDGAFEYPRDGYSDTYPCLFSHHRKRNHEWAKCA